MKLTGSRMGRLWVVLAVLWWVGMGIAGIGEVQKVYSVMAGPAPNLDQCIKDRPASLKCGSDDWDGKDPLNPYVARLNEGAASKTTHEMMCIPAVIVEDCKHFVMLTEDWNRSDLLGFWVFKFPVWLLMPFGVLLVTWGSYRVVRWVWRGAGSQ